MPSRVPATPDNDVTVLYLLKQLDMAVRSRLDELLRPAKVTALQYTALVALERQAGVTSAQLARESFVTAQTMADMVAALEGRRFITRRRDPDDRRRLVLNLTSEGRRLLGRFRSKVGDLEAELLSGLNRAQQQQLRTGLMACRLALVERSSG